MHMKFKKDGIIFTLFKHLPPELDDDFHDFYCCFINSLSKCYLPNISYKSILQYAYNVYYYYYYIYYRYYIYIIVYEKMQQIFTN